MTAAWIGLYLVVVDQQRWSFDLGMTWDLLRRSVLVLNDIYDNAANALKAAGLNAVIGHRCHQLEIPHVIIPPIPGGFSALGLVASDIRRDYVKTFYAGLAAASLPEMSRAYAANIAAVSAIAAATIPSRFRPYWTTSGWRIAATIVIAAIRWA